MAQFAWQVANPTTWDEFGDIPQRILTFDETLEVSEAFSRFADAAQRRNTGEPWALTQAISDTLEVTVGYSEYGEPDYCECGEDPCREEWYVVVRQPSGKVILSEWHLHITQLVVGANSLRVLVEEVALTGGDPCPSGTQ